MVLYCEKVRSIVEELRADSENGAKRLENEYKAKLMAVALRLCTDKSLAEALVYRTFEEVIASLDNYTEQSAFFTWMCKILVNCHAKDTRRKSSETVVFTDVVPDAPDDGAEKVVEAVDAGILRDAIENLPPDMKEAVILRYFMDQPVAKIAQILTLPIGTVKSRLHYARVLLGKRLGANLKKPAVVAAAVVALLFAATAAVAILSDENSTKATVEAAPMETAVQDIPSVPAVQESPTILAVNEGEDAMNAKTMKSMVAAVALGATASNAATWTNGNWSVAENWAEGVVPTAGADVTINNSTAGATFNVDVGSVNIRSLTFAPGGKQCYVVGGTLNISAQAAVVANHSMTISNSLVLSHSTPKLSAATSGRSYYCGDVTLTHATGDLYSFGKGGSTFYGTVTVPRDFRPGGGAAWQGGSNHYFYGPLKCRHVLNDSSYDDTTYHYESTSNSWTYFETGYFVKNAVATAGALPKTAVLRAYRSDYYAGGTCNLSGTDQTIDRLSGTTKLLTVNGGSSAMTLTMLATASDTSRATLNGSLSLVYAPTNSSYVQTINGGACSMNGSLTVSNGTFRAGVNTKFANVKSIVVADGATFDLATTNANALVGVTNIVLGAGAHFAITNAAATPFAASAVTLEMDETSTFDLPEDANYLFAAVTVGGVPLDGDTYTGGGAAPQFSGSGSITVPDVEQPTVDATWTGEGETDGIAVSGNWGGETPALNAKSLYPLFASGGEQATIDRAVDFKGVHFGGAAASFALVSNTPSASLTLRQSGIAVDASHTATVDVPVTIKTDQAWSVASGSTLRFKSPVGMASPYAVAVSGAGTLRLDAENGFLSGFSAAGGLAVDVYSPTNAFGPAGDNAVTVNGKLFLHGAHIERPVTVTGQNNQYYWFGVYGTNEMTKAFTHSSDAYWRPRLYANSRLVCSGGVTVCCDVILIGESGSCWVIKDKPWKHSNLSSSVSQLELDSGATMRFGASGCVVKILMMKSSGRLYCDIDNPFSGRATELQFHGANSMIDLNGHVATFGNVTRLSGGTVTSETPGTLVLSAQSGTITNSAVRFTGAAGFSMSGTGAVWFNRAMESAGSLAVSKGTLGFTANGSWANCTNVTASGTGRLKIAKAKTFSKDATLSIADSGVVEIPEGVVLSVGRLSVDGETLTSGTFGSNDSTGDKQYASHFDGGGVMRVGRQGIMLMVW